MIKIKMKDENIKKKYYPTNHLKWFVGGVFVFCFLFFIFPTKTDAAVLSRPPSNLGLVGYWSMNEGTSTVATDFSGNGNHGTLQTFSNPPTATSGWASGKLGKGLEFDGTSDYISIPNSSSLQMNQNMTIVAWVNVDDASNLRFILEKGLNDNDNYGFYTAGSGVLNFEFQDSGSVYRSFTSNTGAVVLDQWRQVAVVFDDTNNLITFYSNGSVNRQQAMAYSFLGTQTDELKIGRQNYGGSNYYFDGTMDEVRIYNRALSASEIATLYGSGSITRKVPNNLGLVGYWSFNEGVGTIAGDFSGTGKNGTMSGFANPPTATSGWTDGKRGKALNFDGSDDQVTINKPVYPSNLNWSVSGWVKSSVTQRTVYGEGQNGFNNRKVYLVSSAGKMRVAIQNTSGTILNVASTADVFDDKWHHFVFSDANGSASLYIDGVADASNFNYTRTGTFLQDSSNIGCIREISCNDFFSGYIDDVRLYNRALSASDVASLYISGEAKINSSPVNRITEGLLGYWTFDGKYMDWSTDLKIRDASGNGFHGTTTIATSTGPTIGKVGQALNFNRSISDYVSLGTSPTLTPSSAITMAAWTNSNNDTLTQRILDKGTYFFRHQGKNVRCSIDTGSITILTTTGDHLKANEWHHVACTWDGQNIRVYVDGVLIGGPTAKTGTMTDNGNQLRIGSDATHALPFSGKIDDVRLYNRALSDGEIKQLYLMGK